MLVKAKLPIFSPSYRSRLQFLKNLVRFASSINEPTTIVSTSTLQSTSAPSTPSPPKPSSGTKVLPDPPTNCCMSGCANCVWMKYADDLLEYYQDGGAKAKQEIDRLIEDPTIKMFVKMELNAKLNEE